MRTVPPKGDFDALYQARWHGLVRLALFLVDDVESAKDCVQDAFVGLYARPPGSTDSELAYLHRSVVNVANVVAAVLDSEVITVSTVQSTITGDTQISSGFTQGQATRLVSELSAGSLPCQFGVTSVQRR